LSRTCFHGALPIAQILVEHGAALDMRDEYAFTGTPESGDSPLIMACMGNHKEMVEYLLNCGADMEMKGVVRIESM
jgi:ankyrin repeat protein